MPIDYKIVMCGSFNVGKTALVQRLLFNTFNNYCAPTVGAAFSAWRYKNKTFGIWDTAGQERFNSLLPMYFRGANIIIYCHDSANEFTEKEQTKLDNLVSEYCPEASIFIAITKCDKNTQSNISNDISNNIFETSAFTGIGITELFTSIGDYCLNNVFIDNYTYPVITKSLPPRNSKCSC
jgi:small GTP-binding protein